MIGHQARQTHRQRLAAAILELMNRLAHPALKKESGANPIDSQG
jgi:hypothetical protein